MKPAVLMTDPRHFAIRGGANPHTRNPDNTLKTVSPERALAQWNRYVDTLQDHGVDVYVIDAAPELTGMVFAANAGLLEGRLEKLPSSEKTFYESHFTAAHRRGESPLFREFMGKFGFRLGDYPADWQFEGEADGFPVGGYDEPSWIFTYGFRSDPQVGDWLEQDVFERSLLRLRLTNPKYYHGDCLLCDLGGPLLAYENGLDEPSVEALRGAFGDRLVLLDDAEAAAFIANSFYVEVGNDRLLFSSAEIRDETRGRIEEQGPTVVPVDISEFFGKGGGGPKCMVFNLGEIDPDEDALAEDAREFRHRRAASAIRQNW